MKRTPTHATAPTPGSQIGIPTKAAKREGGAAMEIADLERFGFAESNMQRAMELIGLAIDPLGYICDGYTQYAVVEAATRSIAAGGLAAETVKAKLAALVDRARRGDDGKGPAGGSEASTREDGKRRGGEPTTGTPDAGAGGSDLRGVEQNKDKQDTVHGVASLPDAPSTDDNANLERLRRYVQQGPEIISVDGHTMPWASAITPVASATDQASRRVTLRVEGAERLLRDRNGNRIRLPKSDGAIGVGDTIVIGEIHSEHVLVVAAPNQPELDFNHGEDGPVGDADRHDDD